MLSSIQVSASLAGEVGFWGQAVLLAPSGLHAALQTGFDPAQNDLEEIQGVLHPLRKALLAQHVDLLDVPPSFEIGDRENAANLKKIATSFQAIPHHPYMAAANAVFFGGALRFATTKDVLEKMAVITGPPNPFYVLVAPVITAFFIWGGEMESAALMHRDLGDIWIRSDQVDKAREAYCKEGDICLRWAEELSRESGIIQGEDSEFRAYCLANQYVQKLRLAKEAYQRAESEEDLKKIRRFIQ